MQGGMWQELVRQMNGYVVFLAVDLEEDQCQVGGSLHGDQGK